MNALVVLVALAVALPLAVAPGAAAQGRLVVPIIVHPAAPPPGRTETRITVETPQTAGVGTRGAGPGGFASAPATSQEVRIISRPGPASGAPSPAGTPVRTRLIVEPSPVSGGLASPPAGGGGFASAPSFSRGARVQIQQDSGTGAPVTTQEIQIESNGDIETPFVILPE